MRLLIFIKQYLSLLFYLLGINRLINMYIRHRYGNKPSLLVICYHSVEKERASSFELQIDYFLNHGFNFLSGADLIDMIKSHEKYDNRRRYVCLTFDDCYEDNYSIVRPILLKRGLPAIFFAPSRKLGLTSDWYDGSQPKRIMSPEQLKEMSLGFDVGAHTQHHVRLGQAETDIVEKEIIESKNDLELLLGKRIIFFAYPNGSYNENALDILDRTAYLAAFTVEQHTNYALNDRYRVGRYLINPSDRLQFKLKVSGGYDWFYYSRKAIRSVLK